MFDNGSLLRRRKRFKTLASQQLLAQQQSSGQKSDEQSPTNDSSSLIDPTNPMDEFLEEGDDVSNDSTNNPTILTPSGEPQMSTTVNSSPIAPSLMSEHEKLRDLFAKKFSSIDPTTMNANMLNSNSNPNNPMIPYQQLMLLSRQLESTRNGLIVSVRPDANASFTSTTMTTTANTSSTPTPTTNLTSDLAPLVESNPKTSPSSSSSTSSSFSSSSSSSTSSSSSSCGDVKQKVSSSFSIDSLINGRTNRDNTESDINRVSSKSRAIKKVI